MNLKLYLIVRILLIGVVSLLATAGYVLHRSDQTNRLEVEAAAAAVDRHLELQLLRVEVGAEQRERFPDLQLWSQAQGVSGRCVEFHAADQSLYKSTCRGEKDAVRHWPLWFDKFYRWVFTPGRSVVRPISLRGRLFGSISVSNSKQQEIARAWNDFFGLLSLASIIVVGVSTMVFLSINRALQPAQTISAGLQRMEQGDLSFRLPRFALSEWQTTGAAVNRLAAKQEKVLINHKELALRLMDVQEAERRYLVRELHDEFGQCLAGLNAVASSICHAAKRQCPALLPDGENIARITSRMAEQLRGMLLQLRPPDIDELGLAAALRSLVAIWNARGGGQVQYKLAICGPVDGLPEPVPANIYRIVQECITNIAKHSSAQSAMIRLETRDVQGGKDQGQTIAVTIADDGSVDSTTVAKASGSGLLGIRERVAALDGIIELSARKPKGFVVHVEIPLVAPPTI